MNPPAANSTETPTPSFGTGTSGQIEEPMRNFGYTVAAYSVLWVILIGFVFLTHRRQKALDARLDELDRALSQKEG